MIVVQISSLFEMKSFINVYKKQNIIYKIITIMIMVIIVVFLAKITKNTLVGLSYPNELLEPANINLTNSFLRGNVPYARENIVIPGEKEPPINFEYPFLTSIVAALLSYLFAGNVVLAHYFLSYFAMVGTAILGSIIIFKNSRTTVGATTGFLLLMFCHWRYGYISASPDGFGLFVTVLTLYLACELKSKHKEFLCALGTVAAFYSKQYFATICFSIFIYFFLYSKKEAIKYFVYCVIILALSMLIVTWKWPLYWVYSVLLLMHGCFHGWGNAGFLYVFEQLRYLSGVFFVLAVALILAFVQILRKRRVSGQTVKKDRFVSEGDEIPLFLIQLPIQLASLFVFGRNDGAYLTYFLQLLIPSVVIVVLILMEKNEIYKYERIYSYFYCFMAIVITYFGWVKLPMHMLSADEIANWNRAYDLVNEYRTKGDIYHYQATAYNAIENGDSLLGTGHDGDINQGNYDEWMKNDLQQLIFPDAGSVYQENLAYRDVIANRIKNREIAMVVTEWYGNIYIKTDELEKAGYSIKDVIPLQLGNMEYEAYFWVCD